ncbi:hypothetical protein CWI82_09605 [Pseudidiomarina tainanensis]|uniref:Uncharacterized protein n=1 Tax=Pseudidiomarina tainanensis TaxID=502365 RepID=A0ACD2HGE3_9GAMM|nr:EAL domain-containing protein [Pseudidiomarina tainanensis]RZQ55623.1 hypothetical protein CWI82_09605 [Pseudidiomarina tainanensis]
MHSTSAHISHSGDSVKSRTALVIDDDPTSRLVAQWLLHRQGYQVSSFKGVSQDIESISSMAPRKPDVIIIDYLLQDCSAIDFIEKLNAIQGFNEIPKIVITAKRSNESERTALAHGVADFITKPLTTSKFVERVALTSAEKQLQSYKHHGWLPTINPLEINPSDLPNSYSVIIVEQKNFDEIAHHQGMNVAHQSMNELAHTLNLLLAPNHVFMSRISLSQIAVISAVVNANDLAPLLSRLNAPYKKNISGKISKAVAMLACGVATNLGKWTINESIANAMFALLLARKKDKFEVEYFSHLIGHKLKRLESIQHKHSYDDLKSMLRLVYQPQVRASDSQTMVLSASIRLRTPIIGQIPFDELTQVYASKSYTDDIGLHLFERLFGDLRDIPKRINVAMQLPEQLLGSDQFISNLNQLARTYNIEKSRVEIELLQSSVMNIDNRKLVNIFRLKNFGFSIVLDDFGFGCNNFNLLLSLPITKIKLANVFLNPEYFEHRGIRLINSIASAANSEGFKLVIKDIETNKQLGGLKSLPNILFQGSAIGRSLPLKDLIMRLKQQARLSEV